ncbi:DUF2617 family protein [Halobaculum sp. MBLA0147]|uniref:DUF2617 family protein n=1 Tax=Halobaculum sp. MBLA0147 TaxID=3079934 RepID=UPI00352545A2
MSDETPTGTPIPAENSAPAGTPTPTETLTFVHASEPPTTDVTVYDACERSVLGVPFTFRVIGNSHAVAAPALDFYELSSCAPVDRDGTPVTLDPAGETRRLVHETDRLRAETVVERRPLAAFPDEESFDLCHRFEPEAVTTVDVGERRFETYHTYPEYDLTVFSRTSLRLLSDTESDVDGAATHP